MKSKIVFVSLLALVVAFGLLFSGVAGAQEKEKKIENKAEKSRGGGADENIKSKSVVNDPMAVLEAPPEKGGSAKRGSGYCRLNVDNRTTWKIQIYVDGYFVGMVSRRGDTSGLYDEGTHRFYGVAEFTDGSQLTWGPQVVYCDGPFSWTLTP